MSFAWRGRWGRGRADSVVRSRIIFTRRILRAWYTRKREAEGAWRAFCIGGWETVLIRRRWEPETSLRELKKQQRDQVEELKRKTGYYSTRNLLEKYDEVIKKNVRPSALLHQPKIYAHATGTGRNSRPAPTCAKSQRATAPIWPARPTVDATTSRSARPGESGRDPSPAAAGRRAGAVPAPPARTVDPCAPYCV